MPRLAELHLCTGCTACAAVCPKGCISMEADADGFLHPVVDEGHCVGCGLCERVCPVQNTAYPKHIPAAYAVKSRDDMTRLASSSGGVFTELARDILAQGGAVFGAAYDDRFHVVHICAETESNLARIRGAKYAQSDLRGIFPDVKRRLGAGQQVLFSGTPCQALGLKSFLQKDYDNLLLVDLVCHSVPSPLVWERYLEYISGEKTLTAVNLRCKDTGWSHYRYSNRFDFSDGTCRMDQSGESLYMKLFVGGYITRLSCTSCPAKGYARVSDLTLGDFWGIWNIEPSMDDDKGTSLVLVHSEKGHIAIDRLNKKAVTLEAAVLENPAIHQTATEEPLRTQVMEYVREGRFHAAEKLTCSAPVPPLRASTASSFLRRVLGFLKRKLRSLPGQSE